MRLGMILFVGLAVSLGAQASDYGKLPLAFEANRGQTAKQVKFLARGRKQTIFLTSTEAVVRSGSQVTRMKLAGANRGARVRGLDELAGKSNYLIGNDPARWRTNVPTFAKVGYEGVYPGIDLVYYGNDQNLEYDFVVAAGADPGTIRFSLSGNEKLRVEDGDLVVGAMRLHRPVVYQGDGAARKPIDGRFVVHGRQVGFEVGRYDRTRTLVIDPVLSLTYSTYLGGSGGDQANGIAVDSAGNAYVTGFTNSTNFPLKNSDQATLGGPGNCAPITCNDVFATKLNAAGNALVYSTYIGGANSDSGLGIAVDSSGSAYVTGSTSSSDFPTTTGSLQSSYQGASSFVLKLNPAGSAFVYSTYLAASSAAIAIDSAGDAYLTGSANGGLPVTAGAFQTTSKDGDAFVTKLNPSGSAILLCTYLGGSFGDQGTGIAVDPSGNIYVTGNTSSSDFPVKNPYQATIATQTVPDSFVTAFNPTASALIYSTYLGGSVDEEAGGIAVDAAGNAYVTGSTNSPDLPTTPNAFEGPISSGGAGQGYVAKFQANGKVVYSTYLGSGLGGAASYGIAADAQGNAYVTGNASATFPTQDPYQAAPGGVFDNAFVSVLNSAGTALTYSTYLGGNNNDGGYAIALDGDGNVYVTGGVTSTNFPTLNAFQSKFGGLGSGVDSAYGDAFVAKFSTSGAGAVPKITGVVNGASFTPEIVPGSWATIEGSNLAEKTGTWDVINGVLPTDVNGVKVSVGDQQAYVYYVSAGQINFIVPEVPAGSQPVIVTNATGASAPVSATVSTYGPAFFGWPNNQAVATTQSFAYAAASGTFSGVTTTPANRARR